MAARKTQNDEQHIRFEGCSDHHPSMASEQATKTFDGAAVAQITDIVKNLLRAPRSEDVESSARRSHHDIAPPRAPSFSSNVIYTSRKPITVLSPEWYKELQPFQIRSTFKFPRSTHMPDFFRITDAFHSSVFACNSVGKDCRSEADTLYQIQAFLHENLNRQLSVADELGALDVPKVIVDVVEDNWRHLYGISEMIQARYDILCGRRSVDPEQTRILELCIRPPIGTGSFARCINRNLRQLWTTDSPNAGRDLSGQVTVSDDLTRDQDYVPPMPDKDRAQGGITRDKFGLATTWDRVAQLDAKESGGNIKVDEGTFVYIMRSHDLIKERAVYSPWYTFGGFRWRLLLFPQADRHFDDLMNVYLVCGGPSDKGTAGGIRPPEGRTAGNERDGPMEWHCAAEFSIRLLHPSSSYAKEALRRDLGGYHDPVDLPESSSSDESQSNVCPDLVEDFYHVFRSSSDDWGGGVAPFSMLQPGKYADKDMNLTFLTTIRLET